MINKPIHARKRIVLLSGPGTGKAPANDLRFKRVEASVVFQVLELIITDARRRYHEPGGGEGGQDAGNDERK